MIRNKDLKDKFRHVLGEKAGTKAYRIQKEAGKDRPKYKRQGRQMKDK